MGELVFEFSISNPGIRIAQNTNADNLVFDAVIYNDGMRISVDSEKEDLLLSLSFGKVLTLSDDGSSSSDSSDSVKVTDQNLTKQQQSTARNNIDVYSRGETDNQIDTKIDITIGGINALLASI